jgi:hypothetical protein
MLLWAAAEFLFCRFQQFRQIRPFVILSFSLPIPGGLGIQTTARTRSQPLRGEGFGGCWVVWAGVWLS